MTRDEKTVLRMLVELQPNEGETVVYHFQKDGWFELPDGSARAEFCFSFMKTRDICMGLSKLGYIEYKKPYQIVLHHRGYHTRELFWQDVGVFFMKSILTPIVVSIVTTLIALWLSGALSHDAHADNAGNNGGQEGNECVLPDLLPERSAFFSLNSFPFLHL